MLERGESIVSVGRDEIEEMVDEELGKLEYHEQGSKEAAENLKENLRK